jgi:serine protease Do
MRTGIAFLALFAGSLSSTVHGQSGNQPLPVSSSGSGFFVSNDGNVLTNQHVVDDCSAIKIDRAGFEAINAIVTAKDRINDLALLHSPSKPIMVPGFRSQVRLGESISVFGFQYRHS